MLKGQRQRGGGGGGSLGFVRYRKGREKGREGEERKGRRRMGKGGWFEGLVLGEMRGGFVCLA